jgi:16S rRNA (uracil1498-N3)-methyltransferase
MPHFFVPPESIKGKRFTLQNDEARHLAVVLRKKPGDEVRLFDGTGRTYRARIESLNSTRVEGTVLLTEQSPRRALRVRLFQALPKGEKFEWVLQKGAELGIAEIVPVVSERVVTKIPADRLPSRLARWRKIVKFAAEQCGRADIPEVSAPAPLSDALSRCMPDSLTLIPWESEENASLKKVLRGATRPRVVNVFIGPEGGFSPQEVDQARRQGALPVSLGPTILRTETAGLFVTSILLYEFGE